MYPPEMIDELDSQELYDLEEMTLEEIHEDVYSPSRPENHITRNLNYNTPWKIAY